MASTAIAERLARCEVRITTLEEDVRELRAEADNTGRHKLEQITRHADELQKQLDLKSNEEQTRDRARVEAEDKTRQEAVRKALEEERALAKAAKMRRDEWIKSIMLALVGGAIALAVSALKDCIMRPQTPPPPTYVPADAGAVK